MPEWHHGCRFRSKFDAAQDHQNCVGNGKISHLQTFVKKMLLLVRDLTYAKLNDNSMTVLVSAPGGYAEGLAEVTPT